MSILPLLQKLSSKNLCQSLKSVAQKICAIRKIRERHKYIIINQFKFLNKQIHQSRIIIQVIDKKIMLFHIIKQWHKIFTLSQSDSHHSNSLLF